MDLDVLAARVAPVRERARGALGHKALAWPTGAPAPLRRRRRLGYPILLLGYSAQESAHDRGNSPAVHMVSLAHLFRIRSRGTARRGLGRPAQDTIDVHALHPTLGLGHRGHEGCRLLYPRDVDRTHSGQNRRHFENVLWIVVGEADLRSRPSTMRQPGGARTRGRGRRAARGSGGAVGRGRCAGCGARTSLSESELGKMMRCAMTVLLRH